VYKSGCCVCLFFKWRKSFKKIEEQTNDREKCD